MDKQPARLCAVCDAIHFGKGLCLKHYSAKYRDENRALLLRKSLAYQAANKQKVNAKNSLWGKKNKAAVNAKTARHRARKRGADGSHTAAEVLQLFARQKGRCAVCRNELPKSYHKDHITPLISGGSNWIYNIQLLCPPCNTSKNARDPIEFMQARGMLL